MIRAVWAGVAGASAATGSQSAEGKFVVRPIGIGMSSRFGLCTAPALDSPVSFSGDTICCPPGHHDCRRTTPSQPETTFTASQAVPHRPLRPSHRLALAPPRTHSSAEHPILLVSPTNTLSIASTQVCDPDDTHFFSCHPDYHLQTHPRFTSRPEWLQAERRPLDLTI